MTVAVKILDAALREDFGFSNLLWVYSGRRGVHCWVCDPSARKLTQSARGAVAEYLQIVSGGERKTKKVNIPGNIKVHPSLDRAVKIIKESFEKLCLIDQDILGNKERWNKVLALIPDEDLRADCAASMEKAKNSIERWNIISEKVNNYIKNKEFNKRKSKKFLMMEIMLQYAYPRLDIAVSKGMNHLLKAPFVIHPKTGRVCVPFNPAKVEKFDPRDVPTVLQLVEEIDKFTKDADEAMKKVKAYKMTSMKEPVAIFEEFLSNLGTTWKGKLIEQSDAKMDF
jgi:DNA primase small subunit